MADRPEPGPDPVPADEVDRPRVPIADKGETARARPDADAPADGPGATPRVGEGALQDAAADGLVDATPTAEELDFGDGELPPPTGTQDTSVADAAFDDRGPATHLNPDDELSERD